MYVNKAAILFGLPESTLHDRNLGLQPVTMTDDKEKLPSRGHQPTNRKGRQGILISRHSPCCVCKRHDIAGHYIKQGEDVAIIVCGSAADSRLPPFYVFPGMRRNQDLLTDASP
ncbi:hypothetical protein MAR_015901 [Mya arenaria]|uniref:Uncharacterized protein n=1 Tax=Mya arenaria TaxID=6604 RepID=A0ABY7FLK4_MYAAR|nr:hypothetical protein MAR_015901 [Mya arenaria]